MRIHRGSTTMLSGISMGFLWDFYGISTSMGFDGDCWHPARIAQCFTKGIGNRMRY
jgi:hypothetical protein